jgi:arylsulfatase A-like enzyme
MGLHARRADAEAKHRRPNLVVIMTDNQGAWTLGCYGNRDIRTPHIDRLSREGVRFTRAFSCNAVCSPTRASFLTGLIPSQHGVHCYLRANEAQMGPNAYCTIAEFSTLPEILAKAGYTCGLVGKWHLGRNLYPQEGFTYWITTPHGHTTTFYDARVIEDGKVRTHPGYLTELWTNHAVRFIEQNKGGPFFLFLAYNGPYGLGGSLTRPARNRHAAYYADKSLPSFPRQPVHPWLRANRQYVNNVQAMRRYAAEVSGVDDSVGQVMAALRRLALDEQTLVVFIADQGWGGGQHGIWGMGDHTRPLHAFDETMHIPLIFRHTGSIAAGKGCDLMVSTYDLMPTLLSSLGLVKRIPDSPSSPGRDFAAALRRKRTTWENVVFYEFENTRVVRTPDWKYISRHPDGPNELYHLQNDPGEKANLVDDAGHARTRRQLRGRLDRFFDRYADPKYDLWQGGRSKVGRLT